MPPSRVCRARATRRGSLHSLLSMNPCIGFLSPSCAERRTGRPVLHRAWRKSATDAPRKKGPGMEAPDLKRKLVAIMAGDFEGFSRHMERDEAGTLAVLSSHRRIIDAAISEYGGRITGTAGDSVLAEFESVVSAINCAVQIRAGARRGERKPGRGAAAFAPHRDQRGRCDGEGWRHLRGRRQYRGSIGGAGGAGRHLRVEGRARSFAQASHRRVRRSRRAEGKEHRPTRARLQGPLQGGSRRRS